MNLKKLLGIGLLSAILLYGDSVDINNGKIRDEILLAGFKGNLTNETNYLVEAVVVYEYNIPFKEMMKLQKYFKNYENYLINWYVFTYDKENANKMIINEFEWEDYRNKSKIEMAKKVDEFYNKYIGATFIINNSATFKDYDFTNQRFPLDMIDSNTYFTFGEVNGYGTVPENSSAFVSFLNVNKEKHNLPMLKSNAKELVSSNTQREVFLKYHVTIKEIALTHANNKSAQLPLSFAYFCKDNVNKCNNFDSARYFTLKTNISKVEVFDKDKTTLLHTINY